MSHFYLLERGRGPSGTSCSTSNTAFTAYSGTGAASTMAFSNTVLKDGMNSIHLSLSSQSRVAEHTPSAITTGFWSWYINPVSAPTTNNLTMFNAKTSSGGSIVFTCSYNTTGTVKINDNAGTIIASVTTSTLPTASWSRVDLSYTTGTLKLELYPGEERDKPVGTAAANNTKSGSVGATTAISYMGWGATNATSVVDQYLAGFRASLTEQPGPDNFIGWDTLALDF